MGAFKRLLYVVHETLQKNSEKYKLLGYDQQGECAVAVTSEFVRRELVKTDRFVMLEKQIVTVGKEMGL